MVIRVLVVDDSPVIRGVMNHVLSSDADIEVVGTACDAIEAREAIKRLNPDVVTLDVEMPGMDGISFLEKIMILRPTPVVMVSTLTQKGADITMRALEIGAVECVGKPSATLKDDSKHLFADELIAKVKMAASSQVITEEKESAPKCLEIKASSLDALKNRIVGIGSSTGGIQALHAMLTLLPENIPPIVITQHIQDNFVSVFAERLGKICRFKVVEVTKDTIVEPGTAYVASGGMHMEVHKHGSGYICVRKGSERVSGHLPSVDVMFRSLATAAGKDAIGVILTGMGKDGAGGLLAMRNAGAGTIGQNAATCVVYGMPRVAYEIGAVEKELPLHSIAPEIISLLTKNR